MRQRPSTSPDIGTSDEAETLADRLSMILHTTNDGIWDWDLRTDEVYFSARWKEMLGYADHEIAHRFSEWSSRIHPDDRERALATVRAHLDGAEPVFELEHRLRHKDGHYRHIRARGAVQRDHDGRPVRMAGSHMDITEQRRAQLAQAESERTLSTLLGNLPGMAYRCRNNRDWTMEFVSYGCVDLTGYLPRDLLEGGRVAYGDLILPEYRDRIWEAVQQALDQRRSFQATYRIRTAAGPEKWVWEQGCGVFSDDGRLLAIEGFITDVDERMEATRALEDRVARRTTQLQTANDEAQRQLERLSTLTSITSELLAANDLETVLRIVVREASRLCEASGAMVGLIDTEQSMLTAVAAEGEPRQYFEQFVRPRLDAGFLNGTATGQALSRRRPIVVEDYRTWSSPHALRAETMRLGVVAFVVAPLLVDGEPIGVLWVNDTKPRPFLPDDVALVKALADQAALAIHHARLLVQARDGAALEERARLARDLHDSVTQSVYSVGIMAVAAQTQLERDMPELPETLDSIQKVSQEALMEMRGLLYELLPPALQEVGLATALEKLVAAMQVRTSAPIRYSGADVPPLGVQKETAIFRIVQEALGNALKHSHASELHLTLEMASERLVLTIADNGVGFDAERPAGASSDGKRGGMGLRSMRERAAAAGLRLNVSSTPNVRTVVSIEAPVR